MKTYFKNKIVPKKIQLHGAASGAALQDHFAWSNLVMNAACHKRPIVIDSKMNHATEVFLAKEACQYFVDFTNQEEVNGFF